MIKCPNCGAEIEDGSKFCGECGTAIPQSKECPQCHTKLAFGAKFCMECGYSFTNKQAGCVSIGDKNVIAGDVVGKKDAYHVAGNATIVKNEDESKKLVQCSICGKNMAVLGSIKCKSCGKIVCEDCFDDNAQKCKNCIEACNDAASNEYRESVLRIIKDGRISLADRKKLIALQQKIGISASRAMQIESQLKPGVGSHVITDNVKAFDKANRENAFDAFYRKGDYKKATEILAPFFSADTEDEELISMYVGALSKFNPPAAQQVITSLKADVVSAYMANFDIALKNGDLANAEKIINKAEEFWPDDYLVKCHKIVFLCEMGIVSGSKELRMEARGIRDSLPPASTLIEKSWNAFIDLKLESQEVDAHAVAEKCLDGTLLEDIVSQGLDKQGAMYCIVDISGGVSAKKYPLYYMNTESIYDWSDEFKSQLIVLRRVDAGTYVMGHGEADVFDINDDDPSFYPKNPNPRHEVLLTSLYYIAVFPITNQQWWMMMGGQNDDYDGTERNPLAPVDNLSYELLRGERVGVRWPIEDGVDSDSFFCEFREKTGIMTADLPTDAQWEIACRAGVDADYYSGTNITESVKVLKKALSEIAVWGKDASVETVGTRIPNNWGLYDFLGNVLEWCRDPHLGQTSNDVGQYHTYTSKVVNPTGCIYPLGDNVEIERTRRRVRGGWCWSNRPDEITVWYQQYENVDGNAGFRPVFTLNDKDVSKLARMNDASVSSYTKQNKSKVEKLALMGDLSARFLLARFAEAFSTDLPFVKNEYESLAKMGFPAALRALGRLCAGGSTAEEKKNALNYYKQAASLGDEESLCRYKAMAAADERMHCAVNALLEKYDSIFEDGDRVQCFSGPKVVKNADRFRETISVVLSYPIEAISQTVYAVIYWNGYDDAPGYVNMDVLTADGIYIIHDNLNAKISGYISWIDFRTNASLKVVGAGRRWRYLEFCKGISVLGVMYYSHSQESINKARVDFYTELYNIVCDIYTEIGIKSSSETSIAGGEDFARDNCYIGPDYNGKGKDSGSMDPNCSGLDINSTEEDAFLDKNIVGQEEQLDMIKAVSDPVRELIKDGLVQIPGTELLISKTVVTQSLWKCITGENPSRFKGRDRPVEMVSLTECNDFIGKLNSREEVLSARIKFRLPSKKEWWAGASNLEEGGAWTWENSNRETHSVAQRGANKIGLYDVYGNVSEWCAGGYCMGGNFLTAIKDCMDEEQYDSDVKSPIMGLRLAAFKI